MPANAPQTRPVEEMLRASSFDRDYVRRLTAFAVREHPVVLANLALALLSVLLELAAIASVFPLSTIAAGVQIAPDSIWARAFEWMGVQLSFATLLLYFVALFGLRLVTMFVNQATSIYLGKRIQAELSSRAFEHLVSRMALRDIDSRSAGHFISLAGDETARAGAIVIAINQLLAATLLAVIYLATIVLFSPLLGVAVVSFLVVSLASLRGTVRRSQALSARMLDQSKLAHSVFLDSLNGLRSVRALSAEAFVAAKYDEVIRRYTHIHFRIDTLAYAAKLVPALILLAGVGMAAANGQFGVMTPGELATVVTALAFLMRFFPASGQVLTIAMRLLADLRAASDVTHLLEHAPDPPLARTRRSSVGAVTSIDLRDVSFGYKLCSPVLRGFSTTLRAGRSYALVGPSGSGKTTIFDLLMGFYSPDAGVVCINGIPMDEFDVRVVRSRIVLVGQQVAILNDTVANNVRFGLNASIEDVREACQTACIDDFVAGLPAGYDTVLSFQGSNLSGGQRQRIAIARALLRKPDVLLLDESTSGLDAETRDRLVTSILRLFARRIVVFASHDKDLVSRVDEAISPVADGPTSGASSSEPAQSWART
jgi:ABC-type bacteriocin/lantibiotic exporter with double-glycine peptidase domain